MVGELLHHRNYKASAHAESVSQDQLPFSRKNRPHQQRDQHSALLKHTITEESRCSAKKTLCFLLNGCCALSSIPSQKCLWTSRSVSDAVNVSRPFSQQDTTRLYGHVRWDSMGLYGTLYLYGTLWDSMGLWLPKITSLGLSGTSLHLRSALSGKDFLVETEEKISNRQVYQGMVGTKNNLWI